MTTLKSAESVPLNSPESLSLQEPVTPPNGSKLTAKSLFASKTFWAIVFTTTASIAPIIGNAVKQGQLTVDQSVNIVLVLCGVGGAVVGRVQAKEAVYTPNWAPGPNQSDFPGNSHS